MEQPLVFLVIAGVVLALVVYYGGFSAFQTEPIASGPGGGFSLPGVQEPVSDGRQTYDASKTKEKEVAVNVNESPFKGEVRISYVKSGREPKEEYVSIVRSGGYFGFFDSSRKTINLDGWTIEDSKGRRRQIPWAFQIPRHDATPAPVELRPGDEIILSSGDTPFGASFRENICTGYFNEFYTFNPPLTESCPKPGRDELLQKGLNSACIDVIDRAYRCRQIVIGFEESAAGNECVAFAASHINYAGCLKDNSQSPNFASGRWRLFLKSKETLWDARHDRIILRDKNGLIVDEYNY